jgi:2,3-bisphosphoglycerate-dependent phosphoglycerate mutase
MVRTPHSIMGLHTGGNDMHKLVLLRHGESEWNLANRFTGWPDVDLSPKGIDEATRGKLLKEAYAFDVAVSLLRRAIRPSGSLRHGSVDPGEGLVAPQQAPLRRPQRPQQGGDREVRRGAGEIWRRAYATPRRRSLDDERHPRDALRGPHEGPAASPGRSRFGGHFLRTGARVVRTSRQRRTDRRHRNSLRALIKHLAGLRRRDLGLMAQALLGFYLATEAAKAAEAVASSRRQVIRISGPADRGLG